jgi:predicted acetyltransferase
MDADEFTLRPVTDEELQTFFEAEHTAFGETIDPAEFEHYRKLIELDRTLAAFEGDRIVATAGIYSFELTVPGLRQLKAAGVTAVGVLPTHRRRGILTSLMARQLDDVAARGEPLAILTASEGGIYGRFGYGPAIFFRKVDVNTRQARPARPAQAPGRVLLLDKAEAAKLLPAVYDQVRRATVGAVSRTEAWWTELLRDSEHHQAGHGRRFDAVHERAPGEADGYVTYRIEQRWIAQQPRSILHLEELCAVDDEVHAALWEYLLGVDLVETVRAYVPVDDPMPWRLADARQFHTTRTGEHIWARVLDVPAALTVRAWADDGRLVLRVEDSFRPSSGGTFELDVANGSAQVGRTGDAPDLVLGASELGSLYLGGVAWRDLARAGRVTERTPGALERADRLFATHPAPWSTTDF